MAQTIPYQPIRLIETGSAGEPNVYSIPAAGGQTLTEGDIATIAGGNLSKAAANAAISTIAGLVRAGNDSVYHTASPSKTSIFGFDQIGTALMPGTNANPQIIGLGAGIQLEISLNQATTLAASLVGTQVGLGYDATTGYFFADPTAANKIAEIVQVSGGPDALNSPAGATGIGNGALGDSGGRVVVQFLSGLALV